MSFKSLSILGSTLLASVLPAAAGAGVIAEYNFDAKADAASKTTITDVSGHAHDVRFNRVISLNDSDPFDMTQSNSGRFITNSTTGSAANPGTIALPNEYTLEGWINIASASAVQLFNLSSTNGVNGHSGTTYYRLELDNTGTPRARFDTTSSGDNTIMAASAIPLNTWTHLAAVYTVAGDLTLYVNGVSASSTHIGKTVDPVIQNAYVGYLAAASSGVLMDDLRISNTALSPDQLGYHQSFTPEPGAMALLGLGGLLMIRRRRR